MNSRLMRPLLTPQSLARILPGSRQVGGIAPAVRCLQQQHRGLAKVKEKELGADELPGVWFSSSAPQQWEMEGGTGEGRKAPDERTLKLGKTIRILQEKLPTLLISPLPQEILSPHITLQLFPSTHPHLPTVTGKIAYTAALWTSPVAWGRVPVLGNVKLQILSERVVKNGSSSHTSSQLNTTRSEKMIIRWKTCPKSRTNGVASSIDKLSEWLGGDNVPRDKEFHGLFLFEFDEEGRVLTHIIEHAEEGSHWERTNKVVSVTDWLLGTFRGKRAEEEAGLALGCCEVLDRRRGERGGR